MSNETQKLLSAVSLCRRAGRLSIGFDAVVKLLDANAAVLVMAASDLSSATRARMAQRAEGKKAKLIDLPVTMDEIWYGMGKRSGVLATQDENFAAMIARAADSASLGGE